MVGVCDHCGEAVEKLVSCEMCGSRVCPAHKREFGCAVCKGRVQA